MRWHVGEWSSAIGLMPRNTPASSPSPGAGRWALKNLHSYYIVDELMWSGMADIFNAFRLELGLAELKLGDGGGSYITAQRVPFAHMWSPAFVPKPPDWGPEVDVVGNFFATNLADVSYAPAPDLAAFLAAGAPPILITFGSMKFDNAAEICAMVYEVAADTGVVALLFAPSVSICPPRRQ